MKNYYKILWIKLKKILWIKLKNFVDKIKIFFKKMSISNEKKCTYYIEYN